MSVWPITSDRVRKRLGHGDIAPDLLGHRVGRPGPLGDDPLDLVEPALFGGHAAVDQADVVGDRVAVAGEHQIDRHLAGLGQRLVVADQRPGPAGGAVQRTGDQRVRGDVGQQVVATEGHAPLLVPEDGVRRAVPGAVQHGQAAVTDFEHASVGQRSGHRHRCSVVTVGGGEAAQLEGDVFGHAVAQHQRDGEVVFGFGVQAELGQSCNRFVEGGDLGAGALDHGADQADVIDVLVGGDDQTDVLDPVAGLLDQQFELGQRALGPWPGVDQGERGHLRSGSS